jgi:hypothetical protein
MRRERTRVAAWRRTIAERRPSARFSADDMWRGIEREREKEREVVKCRAAGRETENGKRSIDDPP